MRVSSHCQFNTCGTTGAVLTLVGAFFLAFWPNLFNYVLYKQLELSEDSYSNKLWQETPIPVYIEFYFFNWDNAPPPGEPFESLEKPKLSQMGPYVFRENRLKVVKQWNPENNTVTFQQNKTWYFEPSMSKGSLDDLVTTLNIPAISAAFAIRDYPNWIKFILDTVMVGYHTNLTVTKPVREFLFDGYYDPLVNISKLVDFLLPVTIPFDKFGWFYARNGSETYDGMFNMFTGKGDISKFGMVGEWNYENPTSSFKGRCGILKGSAGEFFLPHPRKDRDISLFSPDLCRMISLTYKEEVVVEGIHGYRYWGDKHVFDNETLKPGEKSCYCPSGECPPSGAIDVSTCKFGSPAFISFPHFFNAHPSYREAVDGMRPDENTHQMFIDLEQHTGIPLQVAASLQINILLERRPEYALFQKVPKKTYFPIIWFKERALIDDQIGPEVRFVSKIPDAGYLIFGALLCMGLSILLITAVFFYTKRRHPGSKAELKLVTTVSTDC